MYPYDSLRDLVADLEKRERFLRIKDMDQDKFEMTAFLCRLWEKNRDRTPGFFVENIKVNGKWYNIPVVGNIMDGYDIVAQCLGIKDLSGDEMRMHNLALEKMVSFYDPEAGWKKIKPKIIKSDKAPCKEIVIKGKDIDLFKFPWIKNTPADAGQFISSGCFFLEDPELGRNVGTYRLQVKGKDKVGANFEGGSHAREFVMRAAMKGAKKINAAVAIGVDPITWMLASSRLADRGEDELEIAGGMRGKPVEVVKSEMSDIVVPAHAEIIIEGEIPTRETEEEGPYGEFLGYIGLQHKTFYMKVTAITHRKNPWVYNVWPGLGKGCYTNIPWTAGTLVKAKRIIPNLINLYTPIESTSIIIASIEKRAPGDGLSAGLAILGPRSLGYTKKIVIVVDKDVDPTDMDQVLHALGTRWQPVPASVLIPQISSYGVDPSQKVRGLTSKIVIDATRQLPQEGGPSEFAPTVISVIKEGAKEGFELVDKKWQEYFD